MARRPTRPQKRDAGDGSAGKRLEKVCRALFSRQPVVIACRITTPSHSRTTCPLSLPSCRTGHGQGQTLSSLFASSSCRLCACTPSLLALLVVCSTSSGSAVSLRIAAKLLFFGFDLFHPSLLSAQSAECAATNAFVPSIRPGASFWRR